MRARLAATGSYLAIAPASMMADRGRERASPKYFFDSIDHERRFQNVRDESVLPEKIRHATYPPSIVRLEPVMKPALALAREATNSATSSGSPMRPSGTKGLTIST
jgi:hypothetical protein